jgi:hypothetical protein
MGRLFSNLGTGLDRDHCRHARRAPALGAERGRMANRPRLRRSPGPSLFHKIGDRPTDRAFPAFLSSFARQTACMMVNLLANFEGVRGSSRALFSPAVSRSQIRRQGADWTDRASATGTATLLGELPRQPR